MSDIWYSYDDANTLWNLLPHPSPNHVVRLFAKDSITMVGDYAKGPPELKAFFTACHALNCYVALNPTLSKIGTRHKAEDVTHWSFLIFDVDPIQEYADPFHAMVEILKHFGGLTGHDLIKHSPTVLSSGRGTQAWLRMDDIVLDEQIPRKHARKIMSYWLNRISSRLGEIHGCKIDTTCSDLPRVVRAPGTINLKTNKKAELLRSQKEPYPWLFDFLTKGIPDHVLDEPELVTLPEGTTWQSVFGFLTRKAQLFLTQGQTEPGRHDAIWHTAKCLQELGISRSEAQRALRWGNRLKGKDNELDDNAITHALDTSYGYEEKA